MTIQLDSDFATVTPEVFTGFMRPEPGGYVMRVNEVEEKTSSKGNPMIVLSLDISEGKCKNAFEKSPVKAYQVCTGEQTGRLKGLLQTFKECNPPNSLNDLISASGLNPQVLKGKIIGANLREEEYVSKDGEIKTALKADHFCTVADVRAGNIQVLSRKPLAKKNGVYVPQSAQDKRASGIAGFGIPPLPEDSLPF